MARSPRLSASKARTGRNTPTGATAPAKTRGSKGAASKKNARPGKGPARKPRAASKRTPARVQPGRAQPKPESWAASVGSLVTSQLGREILADVLNAAADVLRQNRAMSQQAQVAGRAVVDRGTDLASTAAQVGTEAASGAVDTGAQITAAAVDIAQTAAGALATVATSAVLNMLPGGSTDDDESQEGEGEATRRRKRARKGETKIDEEG